MPASKGRRSSEPVTYRQRRPVQMRRKDAGPDSRGRHNGEVNTRTATIALAYFALALLFLIPHSSTIQIVVGIGWLFLASVFVVRWWRDRRANRRSRA